MLEGWILPDGAQLGRHLRHIFTETERMTKQPMIGLVGLANADAADGGGIGEGLTRACDASDGDVVAAFGELAKIVRGVTPSRRVGDGIGFG